MTSFEPSVYQPMVDAILSVSDMEKVSVKKIRKALQDLFDIEFNEDKKQVNDLILGRYHHLMEMREAEVERKKRKKLEADDLKLAKRLQTAGEVRGEKRKASSAGPKERKKREPGTSSLSSVELNLSPKLSELLGKTKLPRTQVVKEVWDYIKANDLQNPEDRREILCDDKMQEIFGKKVSMFKMNKVLSEHLYRDDE